MFVQMLKIHQGANEGDVVRFEDVREADALIKSGHAAEVRKEEGGEWTKVARRESIEVADSAAAQ